MRRIARADEPQKFVLLQIRREGKSTKPILPLESNNVDVLRGSPLMDLFDPEKEDLGEFASNLMGPGPWSFQKDLKLPTSCDIIRFTNRNKRANMQVTHMLKVVMRVERGDDLHMDKNGKRKLFDIVVQTPVLILSVSTYTLLWRITTHWTLYSVGATQNGLLYPDTPKSLANPTTLHPLAHAIPMPVHLIITTTALWNATASLLRMNHQRQMQRPAQYRLSHYDPYETTNSAMGCFGKAIFLSGWFLVRRARLEKRRQPTMYCQPNTQLCCTMLGLSGKPLLLYHAIVCY